MAGNFMGTKEEAQIAKLLRAQEIAKLEKNKDKWNLPPVEKGCLRGFALNVRQFDEPCEYGNLQVIEFEVSDTLKGPGVPVRMAGTYFSGRIKDGTVVDVPDPTPAVRPITPDMIYHSHSRGENEVRAFYPGRGETPRSKSLLLGLLGLGLPAVAFVGVIAMLHYFLRIF